MKSFNGAPGAWWADNPAYGEEAEQAKRAVRDGIRCETCGRRVWDYCVSDEGGIREVFEGGVPDYWYMRCGGRWWEPKFIIAAKREGANEPF